MSKFLLLLSKVKPIWERISNLFLDFENEVYSVEGTPSTLSSYVTHSRSGNATMVDSDGLIKWAPHNLLTYSEDLTNSWTSISATIDDSETVSFSATTGAVTGAAATTVAGAGYTVAVELWSETDAGEQVDIGFNTNDLSNTFSSLITLTATPTLYTFSKSNNTATQNSLRIRNTDGLAKTVKVRAARLYRSDLGGMVDNPDRGDSYVPTTSSAVHLPRRGHHVYNGSTWVNEGLLVESESRQNLITYSQDFTDASWNKANTGTLSIDATGPDGEISAVTLVDNNAGGTGGVYVTFAATVATSTTYTYSVFLKADQLSRALLYVPAFTSPASNGYYFDLINGTYSAYSGTPDMTPNMENVGNGWYRCSLTFTTDATDTTGNLQVYVAGAVNESVDLDGTSSILIYGAQFEAGSTPSSYIPTAGSTVTRAAETLTIPAANLPYPSPVVIGSELVTNGTFDTDTTGWTAIGGGTIESFAGTLRVNRVSGGVAAVYEMLNLNVGSVYKLEYDLVSGSPRVDVSTSGVSVPGTGVFDEGESFFVATATTMYLRFSINSGDGTSVQYDNISVQEINPLSVSIQMDGTMTYADTNVATEVIFHRWLFDGNNQIQARLDTASTDTGQVQFYSIANTVVDVVESSATTYSPGINVPFNIASRHGSTFINGAVDGTALTADTTPVALPDLETTDLDLAYDFMGTIRTFRIWDEDLTDEGIEYVSQ